MSFPLIGTTKKSIHSDTSILGFHGKNGTKCTKKTPFKQVFDHFFLHLTIFQHGIHKILDEQIERVYMCAKQADIWSFQSSKPANNSNQKFSCYEYIHLESHHSCIMYHGVCTYFVSIKQKLQIDTRNYQFDVSFSKGVFQYVNFSVLLAGALQIFEVGESDQSH